MTAWPISVWPRPKRHKPRAAPGRSVRRPNWRDLDAACETVIAALRRAEKDVANRTARVETAQGRLTMLLAEVGRVQKLLIGRQAVLSGVEQRSRGLRGEAETAETDLATRRAAMAEAEARAARLARTVKASQSRIAALEVRRTDLEAAVAITRETGRQGTTGGVDTIGASGGAGACRV